MEGGLSFFKTVVVGAEGADSRGEEGRRRKREEEEGKVNNFFVVLPRGGQDQILGHP